MVPTVLSVLSSVMLCHAAGKTCLQYAGLIDHIWFICFQRPCWMAGWCTLASRWEVSLVWWNKWLIYYIYYTIFTLLNVLKHNKLQSSFVCKLFIVYCFLQQRSLPFVKRRWVWVCHEYHSLLTVICKQVFPYDGRGDHSFPFSHYFFGERFVSTPPSPAPETLQLVWDSPPSECVLINRPHYRRQKHRQHQGSSFRLESRLSGERTQRLRTDMLIW